MKEAINNVGDKYKLPNGWLNTSFERTTSFSPKLLEHSDFFKTYSNLVDIVKEKPGSLHPSNIDEVLAKVKMKLAKESQNRDDK